MYTQVQQFNLCFSASSRQNVNQKYIMLRKKLIDSGFHVRLEGCL